MGIIIQAANLVVFAHFLVNTYFDFTFRNLSENWRKIFAILWQKKISEVQISYFLCASSCTVKLQVLQYASESLPIIPFSFPFSFNPFPSLAVISHLHVTTFSLSFPYSQSLFHTSHSFSQSCSYIFVVTTRLVYLIFLFFICFLYNFFYLDATTWYCMGMSHTFWKIQEKREKYTKRRRITKGS